MVSKQQVHGDLSREAVRALGGYVYQIYQSALAWIEIGIGEFLYLEVAEDYALLAENVLNAVQVKETAHTVTINSKDVIASIDSFVDLKLKNPDLLVRMRHLTTSTVGKERSGNHRIGDEPTLDMWRRLASAGDVVPIRKILEAVDISAQSKNYIKGLDDIEFRENFLKRIHFDCGALDSKFLLRKLKSKLLGLLTERGGVSSHVDVCLNKIIVTLLQCSIKSEDRFVDRLMLEELFESVTRISINRSQYESQNNLINQLLSKSFQNENNLFSVRVAEPRSIDDVPMPRAIATRKSQVDKILTSVIRCGVGWISGASGVGKTVAARVVARYLGGAWGVVNLRGLGEDQVGAILSVLIDKLSEYSFNGFIIDDIECSFNDFIIDKILYLHALCRRSDALLIFTSYKSPNPSLLLMSKLDSSIEQTIEGFSLQDVQEILSILGTEKTVWAKYVHTMSGGGHPQLVSAVIQSLQVNGWSMNESEVVDSLLLGNPVVEDVRKSARERLLNELPEGCRRLIERLSLRVGAFRRSFVLDMAQVQPVVSDGGLVFDRLIGSWIDQHARDSFSVSPLLSDFGLKNLTDQQRKAVHYEIADSLIRQGSLNAIEANSALMSAIIGKNSKAIFLLCMGVIGASYSELKMIAPHFFSINLLGTTSIAYEDDPSASQVLRGTQLLLALQEESDGERLVALLECFKSECDKVKISKMRDVFKIYLYARLLLGDLKSGAFPKFLDLIWEFEKLVSDSDGNIPLDIKNVPSFLEVEGVPIVSYMFVSQMNQIKLIQDLIPIFENLQAYEGSYREKLLLGFDRQGFGIDMLITGAWLSESNQNTLSSIKHSSIFERLELIARSWSDDAIAVCCRKYHAILIDEFGLSKDDSLKILDEGLAFYGSTNSELVRTKAKILYRADEHQESLALSKVLIEGNAKLNEIEKAFLGREAAISAENQFDYQTARDYYLYGSLAAERSAFSDMLPMKVGLMADAALASWHLGDRESCLLSFKVILQELVLIDKNSSLRAAHCHAVCRHVLLWLRNEASGLNIKLDNNEDVKIYPGMVSNPEPSSKIKEKKFLPIEMAWYMLAAIENYCCLDVGITRDLNDLLPSGPVYEGQVFLSSAKIKKSLDLLDCELYIESLKDVLSSFFWYSDNGEKRDLSLDSLNYGVLPFPSLNQQASHIGSIENLILCFVCKCIFVSSVDRAESLIDLLIYRNLFSFKADLLGCLKFSDGVYNDVSDVAKIVAFHKKSIEEKVTLHPEKIFEFMCWAMKISGDSNNFSYMKSCAFYWLQRKLAFVVSNQKFLLKYYSVYGEEIERFISITPDKKQCDVIGFLLAVLPTLGFSNESEVRVFIQNLKKYDV